MSALFGNGSDTVKIGVVMEHAYSMPFGNRCDQQIGQRDGSHLAQTPEFPLHTYGSSPVNIFRGEPFISKTSIFGYVIKLL